MRFLKKEKLDFPLNNLENSVEEYGFFESFPAGYNLSKTLLENMLINLLLIFNADNDLAGEMGGFG